MTKKRKPVRRNRRDEAGTLALAQLQRARNILCCCVSVLKFRVAELDMLDTRIARVIDECERIAKGGTP